VQPANQVAQIGVVFCHKKIGDPCCKVKDQVRKQVKLLLIFTKSFCFYTAGGKKKLLYDDRWKYTFMNKRGLVMPGGCQFSTHGAERFYKRNDRIEILSDVNVKVRNSCPVTVLWPTAYRLALPSLTCLILSLLNYIQSVLLSALCMVA